MKIKIITSAYSMEFEAEGVEKALDLYAREAGYADFDDLVESLGETRSQALADPDFIVKEVDADGNEWRVNF